MTMGRSDGLRLDAEKVQARRTFLGLTQAELATKSGLGLGYVRDIELGRRTAERSPRTRCALARALRCSEMAICRRRDSDAW